MSCNLVCQGLLTARGLLPSSNSRLAAWGIVGPLLTSHKIVLPNKHKLLGAFVQDIHCPDVIKDYQHEMDPAASKQCSVRLNVAEQTNKTVATGLPSSPAHLEAAASRKGHHPRD